MAKNIHVSIQNPVILLSCIKTESRVGVFVGQGLCSPGGGETACGMFINRRFNKWGVIIEQDK